MKHVKDKKELGELLSRYDTYLFDCDGVVWTGDELTPKAAEALAALRKHGKKLVFITNNATASRRQYRQKFEKLGIEVNGGELFTSGSAAAQYVKAHLEELPKDKRNIYLIGQAGLAEELDAEGLKYSGGTDHNDDQHMPFQDFTSILPDASVGFVVAGFDMHITYKKLCKAFNYLATNDECRFVLTNDDSTVILPNGNGSAPGEGAMFAPLMHARKDLKPVVVGKPNQILMDSVRHTLDFDPQKAIMIGDRMQTDMPFGRRGGVHTMLVLTGADTEEDLESAPEEVRPEYVVGGIGDFVDALAS